MTINSIEAETSIIQEVINKYNIVIKARINANTADTNIDHTIVTITEYLKEDTDRVMFYFNDIGIDYDNSLDDIFSTYNSYIESLKAMKIQNQKYYEEILTTEQVRDLERINRAILLSEKQASILLRNAANLHSSIGPRLNKLDADLLQYYRATLVTLANKIGLQYKNMTVIKGFFEGDEPFPLTTYTNRIEAEKALRWASCFVPMQEVDKVRFDDLDTQRKEFYRVLETSKFPMTFPLLQQGGANAPINDLNTSEMNGAENISLDSVNAFNQSEVQLYELTRIVENQTVFTNLAELQRLFIDTSKYTIEESSSEEEYREKFRIKVKSAYYRTKDFRAGLNTVEKNYDAILNKYFTKFVPEIVPIIKEYIYAKKTLFMDTFNRAKTASDTVATLTEYYKLESDSPDPIIFRGQRREILQKKEEIRLLFEQKVEGFKIEEGKAYIEAQEQLFNEETFVEPYKIINFFNIAKINSFFDPRLKFVETVNKIVAAANRVQMIVQSAIIVVEMREGMDTMGDPVPVIDEDPTQLDTSLAIEESKDGADYKLFLKELIRKKRRERVYKQFRKDPIDDLDTTELLDSEVNATVESNVKLVGTCAVGNDFDIRNCFLRRYPDVKK